MFEQTDEEGKYAVNLTKNGEKERVIVDDRFPCLDGELVFSRAKGAELWVLIL